MALRPQEGETVIGYDSDQRRRYEAGRRSVYDRWRWPKGLLAGRNNRANRCFPEVAARAHFEQAGYTVLVSSPKYPDDLGFLLFNYRGMRRKEHPAFTRLQAQFPDVDLHSLAERARRAKMKKIGRGGGGDPDLFVFHPQSGERFFVEVKLRDSLRANQVLCFRLIERHLCPVKVVRLVPSPGPRH